MARLRLLILVTVVVFASSAWAQLIPDPDVQGKINDSRQEITLNGKIAYAKEFGGYFFQTDSAGNFFS